MNIPKIKTIRSWDGKDKGDAYAHEYLSIDHLQEWIDLWKTVPPLCITHELRNEWLEELETFIYEKEETKMTKNKSKLDLVSLSDSLDTALKNETKESLTEWLKNERQETTLEEAVERLYLSDENNQFLYGHSEELQLAYKAGVFDGAKWQQEEILQFLYSEIIERRPYSASKMCEKVIEFMEKRK